MSKISFKTKAISTLLSLLLILQLVPLSLFAADSAAFTDTCLDFAYSFTDESGDGWEWDYDNLTLTITEDGLTMELLSVDYAIVLPANSIVEINGDLVINSTNGLIGIWGRGDLTINVNADFTCTSATNSIYVLGDLTMNIYGDSNTTIIGRSCAICAYETIDIYNEANLTLYATSYSIESVGDDITIINDGTIEFTGNSGIRNAGKGDVIIGGSGLVTFDVNNYSIYTLTLYVKDTATVNVLNGIGETLYGVTVEDAATFNGIMSYYDNGYYYDTIYGDFAPDSDSSLYYGSLSFDDGATLTVPVFTTFDLSGYTIDYTGGTIINNGMLTLPTNTNLADVNFEGVGIVSVDSVLYNNQGELLSVNHITLSDYEVITDDYTWTVDTDGVYTLKILCAGFDSNVLIEVENFVIDLQHDTIINTLYIAIEGDDYDSSNVTITGNYTLYVMDEIHISNDLTTVTIDEGTTVLSTCFYTKTEDLLDIGFVLNGNLKVQDLVAHSLTINNGGSLEVIDGNLFLYAIDDDTTAPVFILGDNVSLITPVGGGYVIVPAEYADYRIGTITTDGNDLDFEEFSNLAMNFLIGTVISEDTGSGDTDTDADTDADTDTDTESDLADTGVDTNIVFVVAIMLTSLAVLVKTKKTAK